jgi:hypothetical protein
MRPKFTRYSPRFLSSCLLDLHPFFLFSSLGIFCGKDEDGLIPKEEIA